MDDQMGTSSGGAAGGMDQAKAKAREVLGQAKETGGQVAGQARDQVMSGISSQKEQITGSLDSVAIAIRQSVDTLRDDQQNAPAGLLETAAGAVENVSTYLREHEIEDLSREVENFARRQPAVFLTGAFALGFLGARFLKSGGNSGGGNGSGQKDYSGSYQASLPAGNYSSSPTAGDTMYGSGGAYSATGSGNQSFGGGTDSVSSFDDDEALEEDTARSTL